ncbi:MAG: hypothetical protein AAF744_01470 [Pseudomonadota bacterium]
MAQVFLILAAMAALVAFVFISGSVLAWVADAGRSGLRRYAGLGKEGVMAPTTFQKLAYVALIVVLFGVATGWLGGW